jgi:putative SOS response-associated peptidase YedK
MCGRFTNRLTWREIVALYRLSVPAMPERNLPARYNICPTDFDDWLAGNAGSELLKPAPNDYLQAWPVSRRVNSSRAPGDDQTLVDRVAA